MAEFGLLGQKLGYSYSKKIHEAFGLYDYDFFERQPEELDGFFNEMRAGKIKGVNVTIPYKRDVQKYLDKETAIAQRIGAVNTIYLKGGKLIGDNTDYYGFLHLLNLVNAKTNGKKVLILGRGGAAKCVREAMKDRHAGTIWQTHRHELADLSKMADAEIIVNSTPIGTAKTELEGKRPCDLKNFPKLELVIDLVYNPEETPLLKQAKELGIKCIGGMEMLKFQGEKAAHRFMSTKNVVLIGMPGCGKTVIGKALAEKTGRSFVDTDAEITKTHGKPCEIIKKQGEKAFREIESQCLSKLVEGEMLVISTGGGIVTQEENKKYLKGCLVIWLERDLDLLETEGRPLSTNLIKLYEEREELYEDFAHISFENNDTVDSCVSEIKKVCKI